MYEELIQFWNNAGKAIRHIKGYYKEHILYDHIKDFLPLIHSNSFIDYGCGGGLVARKLIEKGLRGIGLDISQDSVLEARKLGVIAYQIKKPSDIDFYYQKQELFVCLNVIQHFPDVIYLHIFLDCIKKYPWKEIWIQYKIGQPIQGSYEKRWSRSVTMGNFNPEGYSLILQKDFADNRYQLWRTNEET